MESCQFSKRVSESGPGEFSVARPATVSSAELQYSRSRPCSLCFCNHREMHVGNGFQSGASASEAVLQDANSVEPRAKYPSSLCEDG